MDYPMVCPLLVQSVFLCHSVARQIECARLPSLRMVEIWFIWSIWFIWFISFVGFDERERQDRLAHQIDCF